MRIGFTILLMTSLLGIAVLGLFSMDHGNNHGGCLAATANGADCPDNNGPVAFADFHLKAFQVFSTAIFNNASLILAAFSALLLLSGFLILSFVNFKLPVLARSSRRSAVFKLPVSERDLIRWLSLKENSPALLF